MLCFKELGGGYGHVPVIMGIGFDVDRGEVVAILGRNGTGKTTLLRILAGILPAASGNIELDGIEVTRMPPFKRARSGIAYVPQGRGIFNDLTVYENLSVGTRAAARERRGTIPADVYDYFPILQERGAQVAGTLSGGQQQMLAIARALCGEPSVLLLDEPSEGIQPNIVHAIGELIPRIARERGIAVVLVEQNLELAFSASSRCHVMDKGRIVHSALPSEMADETVLKDLLAI